MARRRIPGSPMRLVHDHRHQIRTILNTPTIRRAIESAVDDDDLAFRQLVRYVSHNTHRVVESIVMPLLSRPRVVLGADIELAASSCLFWPNRLHDPEKAYARFVAQVEDDINVMPFENPEDQQTGGFPLYSQFYVRDVHPSVFADHQIEATVPNGLTVRFVERLPATYALENLRFVVHGIGSRNAFIDNVRQIEAITRLVVGGLQSSNIHIEFWRALKRASGNTWQYFRRYEEWNGLSDDPDGSGDDVTVDFTEHKKRERENNKRCRSLLQETLDAFFAPIENQSLGTSTLGLQTGIHFLIEAMRQHSDAIAILLVCAALEALVVRNRGPPTGTIAQRVARAVAAIVFEDERSRRKLFRLVRNLYRLRSAIVHGSALYESIKLVGQVKMLAASVLRSILDWRQFKRTDGQLSDVNAFVEDIERAWTTGTRMPGIMLETWQMPLGLDRTIEALARLPPRRTS